MKPATFEYLLPGSVEETVGLLEQHEDDAKIIAGGQSLIPLMNFRLARPKILVDINGIKSLSGIKEEEGKLVIGALTRENEAKDSVLVQEHCPIFSQAISKIGHAAIRNRGTIGGSLVHCDPSAELPTVSRVLNAEMRIVGSDGEKLIEAEDFFITYLTSVLEPSEILLDIRIPKLNKDCGWSFVELSRRSGDFAIVAVAVILIMDEKGVCREARISLGGVEATPIRAEEAESYLAGKVVDGTILKTAGKLATENIDPESDYHASAEYRENMVEVMVIKGLEEALARTKGGQ